MPEARGTYTVAYQGAVLESSRNFGWCGPDMVGSEEQLRVATEGN